MEITCGNLEVHEGILVKHASVEAVRACFAGRVIGTCNWLVAVPAHFVPELDDWCDPYERDCGALMWDLVDGRGYTCESGHEHIYDEVRAHERWDYAADSGEAGLLAGYGVHPVAMDGTGIEIDLNAMRHAMSGGA